MHDLDVGKLSDVDLTTLRANTEIEMKSRGLPYSVGDIGELLAIEYFSNTKGLPNLQAAPVGTKNIDALSRNGDRYSIKTRLNSKKTSAIYLDENKPGKQLFEYILLVKISERYDLESIYQFTWDQFTELKRYDKRMSASYLSCSKVVLEKGQAL